MKTLKMVDIINCINAISALDVGQTVIVNDGGRDRSVSRPFAFSGATLFALAKALRALQDVHAPFEDTRRKISAAAMSGRDRMTAAEMFVMEDELRPLLDAEHKIDLPTLTEADLNLGTNSIPPTVVVGLLHLL